jgi:hypothetical protein
MSTAIANPPHARRVFRTLAAGVGLAAAMLAAGCGTQRFDAKPSIPTPLVVRIPAVVGLYVPPEFSDYVHKEKRDGLDYEIAVGPGQSEGFARLLDAMFTRVVRVPSAQSGAVTDAAIRGVLEPMLEELSFITPRDTGEQLYAVSLKYRINAYSPQGELVDSWSFTGYGASAASSIPGQGTDALQEATRLAMRDAGAKIAAEFHEQAIVRGLLPPEPSATSPAVQEAPTVEEAPAETQPRS